MVSTAEYDMKTLFREFVGEYKITPIYGGFEELTIEENNIYGIGDSNSTWYIIMWIEFLENKGFKKIKTNEAIF